nr:MAG TPA: hypothetical protein [Caudoviricetes sp.]
MRTNNSERNHHVRCPGSRHRFRNHLPPRIFRAVLRTPVRGEVT